MGTEAMSLLPSAALLPVSAALQAACASGLARIDAQLLLLHTLGRPLHDRSWLIAHGSDALPAALQAPYLALCARRLAGEPVAYLTGHKAFFGLDLLVDARVLDPRPDTETLVEWGLEVIAGQPAPVVLDLGTGSGAVALALQHSRPDARVHATDASAGALAVALANATRLQLAVTFSQGSWFDALNSGPSAAWPQAYQLIVSNPPYIAQNDPHLLALAHEPQQALTAGAEGLDDLRHIVANASGHLLAGGWLLLEHGHDQADAVCTLLRTAGFAAVQTRADLAGLARCSGGQWQAGQAAASGLAQTVK